MKMNSLQTCCPELHYLVSAGFFGALCDANRLLLLWRLLTNGPASLTTLASEMTVDISVVSRHLRTLREAEIVSATRKGREVRYAADALALVRTLRGLADFIEISPVSQLRGGNHGRRKLRKSLKG
jgi:DNA-binding transcriptional ArsR family regulator